MAFRLPAVLLVPTTFLAAAQLAGCSVGEEAVAEGVVTSALATHDSGGVGDGVTHFESTCVDDPELAAQEAATRPSVAFIPSDCVDKTASGNTVHAELDACSGRFGRATATGGLDAIIHKTDTCKLGAEITDSGDLVINGAPFDYYASADVQLQDDGSRDIDWEASWSGATRKGLSISQSSELQILRTSDDCVTIDGSANGTVEETGYSLDLGGLAMCPDACPTAGTVEGRVDGRLRDRTFTVEFDGSATAHVESTSGSTYEVAMDCTPAD
jgi:hypothetical protein